MNKSSKASWIIFNSSGAGSPSPSRSGGSQRNCDIGLRSMFVYANGDVHFCDYLKKPIGNIIKTV